jgi:hypothetical protein
LLFPPRRRCPPGLGHTRSNTEALHLIGFASAGPRAVAYPPGAKRRSRPCAGHPLPPICLRHVLTLKLLPPAALTLYVPLPILKRIFSSAIHPRGHPTHPNVPRRSEMRPPPPMWKIRSWKLGDFHDRIFQKTPISHDRNFHSPVETCATLRQPPQLWALRRMWHVPQMVKRYLKFTP